MADSDERYRIPADIEREDRILAGLTVRQVAILGGTGVVLWLAFVATRDVVPLSVFAGVAFPIGVFATVIGLGRRDGLSMDQLLVHGLRQARAARRLVAAPRGVPAPPAWVERSADLPAPLRMPARAISPDGVIDLGSDGCAVIAETSMVSFALRTAEEQSALVAAFGAWLNSLSGPVQILVRAEDVDLAPLIDGLVTRAPALPHPALEQAAIEHGRFLAELAERRDLLRRQAFIVIREPVHAPGQRRGDAGPRALRRLDEAARALAGAGITARVLPGEEARAVIATCCSPWRSTAPYAPDGVITAGGNPE